MNQTEQKVVTEILGGLLLVIVAFLVVAVAGAGVTLAVIKGYGQVTAFLSAMAIIGAVLRIRSLAHTERAKYSIIG